MKKLSLILTAILLVICILFSACAKADVPPTETDEETNLFETESESESETWPEGPVTVKERYLPEEIEAEVKASFEGKKGEYREYPADYAPYAICDVYTLSDGRITSLTIPVYKTGEADDEGNFVFTLFVIGNSYEGLRTAPKKTIPVKINAAKNQLVENASEIFRWLVVDLSSYDIVLTKDETLAFFSATDTLIPAYIGDDPEYQHDLLTTLKFDFPQATGFTNHVGTAQASATMSSVLIDFEIERTYECYADYYAVINVQAEYEEMIRVIKEKYGNGYVSVLGDSISTFSGVSNDARANSTLGDHEFYYPRQNSNVPDKSMTYWGKFIADSGMRTGVINSWSGSRVYGRTNVECMLTRATQLHRDKGTSSTADDIDPSLIFVYMGINDLRNYREVPFGDLYEILETNNGKTDREKVAAWFAPVLANAKAVGEVKRGTTYETFEQAYALSLYAMMERYENADIYCLTLQEHYDVSCEDARVDKYNRCIKAIAEYFGVGLVDQDTGDYRYETAHAYTNDHQCLHPNAMGHMRMTELIVKTIYEDIMAES